MLEQPGGGLLTGAQVAAYQTHGFVLLRNVFSPEELASLRPSIPLTPHSTDTTPTNAQTLYNKCVIWGNPETDEDPTRITKLEGMHHL
jgi:hypothetical protein